MFKNKSAECAALQVSKNFVIVCVTFRNSHVPWQFSWIEAWVLCLDRYDHGSRWRKSEIILAFIKHMFEILFNDDELH